jgi:D-alanyl-D-alanine dipeptidase
MIVETASELSRNLDLIERSKVSFRQIAFGVPRVDDGEAFVEEGVLREYGFAMSPFWNTAGDPEGECYKPYIAKHPSFGVSVRRSVAERLKSASERLPEHWKIHIKAGYRPIEVQRMVLDTFITMSRERNPEWSDAEQLAQARTFVADPEIVCPPHTTGGAVDIDIEDTITGQMIDMGCPPNTDNELSFLHNDMITEAQHQNRMTLLEAMLEAGFAPNPFEWWHFQYGETYWAAFYGEKQTKYDSIKV